jgi:hypothetical protein
LKHPKSLYQSLEFRGNGISIILAVNLLISTASYSDQITHKFKSPSFNGQNTSSHYLTIENQEFNRKADIAAEIKAYQEELVRDAETQL